MKKITYAQRSFMDSCAAGCGSTSNTNPQGCALEKIGFAEFEYSSNLGFHGRWKLTEKGIEWRNANLNSFNRLNA